MADDRFQDWHPPQIEEGKPTKWNWVVQGVAGLKLGRRTDIGAFTYINARHEVEIGDEVQIGSHCSIYSMSTIDGKQGKVTIGKGACIGTHSVVLPGVTIGENSIIGAFSLVNKDIPPNVIAYGQPAHVARERS
ncbi:MAG: hypothetical protein RLZZ165_195 [Bacteroidota bacterium]|jgi:acetyltransferase-like isoleucine patch superfamily enzyme